MIDKHLHDLSFVPASQLEANLGAALGGIGQHLKHQKLKELAARVQGYPSLNHRASSIPRKEVTFLVDDLSNPEGSDIITLEIAFVLVTFNRDDLDRIKRAHSAAQCISDLATISFPGCKLDGFRDSDDGIELSEPFASASMLNADNNLYIRTSGVQISVGVGCGKRLWVSGKERHGFSFTTPDLPLEVLEQAFVTGRASCSGWHLVSPSNGQTLDSLRRAAADEALADYHFGAEISDTGGWEGDGDCIWKCTCYAEPSNDSGCEERSRLTLTVSFKRATAEIEDVVCRDASGRSVGRLLD